MTITVPLYTPYSLSFDTYLSGDLLLSVLTVNPFDSIKEPVMVLQHIWRQLTIPGGKSIYSTFSNLPLVGTGSYRLATVVNYLYYSGMGVSPLSSPLPQSPFLLFVSFIHEVVPQLRRHVNEIGSGDEFGVVTAVTRILRLMEDEIIAEVVALILILDSLVISTIAGSKWVLPLVTKLVVTLVPKHHQWLPQLQKITSVTEFAIENEWDYIFLVLEHGRQLDLRNGVVATKITIALMMVHAKLNTRGLLSWIGEFNRVSTRLSVTATLCYFLYLSNCSLGIVDERIDALFDHFASPPLPQPDPATLIHQVRWVLSLRVATIFALDLLIAIVQPEMETVSPVVALVGLCQKIVGVQTEMIANAVVPAVAIGKSLMSLQLGRLIFSEIAGASTGLGNWFQMQAVFDVVVKLNCRGYTRVINELVNQWRGHPQLLEEITQWLKQQSQNHFQPTK